MSASLVLQLIIIYTPIGSAAFDTTPLGLEQWGILAAGLAAGFVTTLITGKLGKQVRESHALKPGQLSLPGKSGKCRKGEGM